MPRMPDPDINGLVTACVVVEEATGPLAAVLAIAVGPLCPVPSVERRAPAASDGITPSGPGVEPSKPKEKNFAQRQLAQGQLISPVSCIRLYSNIVQHADKKMLWDSLHKYK